jgi:hypothetical protein
MFEFILLLKFVFLVLSIAYGFTNVAKVCYGHPVGEYGIYLMAVPMSLFVCFQWMLK